uniref:SDR family oxidoreductase n=1 Tax=Escherichia coli TaxID=562 RepID=UPI000F0A930F
SHRALSEHKTLSISWSHYPNRWGDTQDLMGAAVFLASPASNYVNGHLLVVDGGYLVR